MRIEACRASRGIWQLFALAVSLVSGQISQAQTPSGARLVSGGYTLAFPVGSLNGKLIFTGVDATGTQALLLTDGAATDPLVLATLPAFGGMKLGNALGAAASSRKLYFTRSVTPLRGGTPRTDNWSTDGTAAGTAVWDSYSGYPSDLFVQCNRKVFWSRTRSVASAVNSSLSVLEDSTPVVLQQLSLRSQWDSRQFLRVAGQRLFFWANDAHDPALPVALWITDGTDAGTRRLRAFGDAGADAAVWQDSIFFVIPGTGSAPYELWRSDGTVEGTTLISPLPGYGHHIRVAAPDRVFLAVTDSVHGDELWFSDGTAAGTNLVREIVPSPEISVFWLQSIVNGRLLFVPREPTFGSEPWISDGTFAGTHILKDLSPGPTSSNARPLAAFGNTVVLRTLDPIPLWRELWVTDGTSAGTTLIKSLDKSSQGSGAGDDVAISGGYAVFAMTDSSHGEELWVTDGTAANTRMVLDLDPGPASGSPIQLTLADADPEPLLYFSSYFRSDNHTPTSLWALPVSSLLAPTTIRMSADQDSPWLTRVTAAVSSPNGSPSGTVRFRGLPRDPSADLASGSAVLRVQLSPGNYATRGIYQGDSKFAGSESPEVTFVVPDYGIASPSATQLAFAPQLVGTDSATQNLVVRNAGRAPFAVTAVNVSGAFRTTHDCTTLLSPSQSCTIGVVFTPSAIGAATGTLSILTDHSPPVPAIALSGSGGDFSLTVLGATTTTVVAGQTAVFEIAVGSIAGLASTVSLNCNVQPSDGSCIVNPAMVALQGNNSSRATVTIATAGTSRAAAHSTGAVRWTWAFLAFGACVPAFARRGRKLFLLPMILLLAACGGESPRSATRSGSYSVVISGSIGAVTRTTSITVVVR